MANTDQSVNRTGDQSTLLAAAGAGFILFGLARKGIFGKLLGVVPGVYLGAQAYASSKGQSVGELISRARSSSLEQRVRIERPPREVYDYVRDFRNMSKFMTHTHDVRQDDSGRVHWVIKAMKGLKIEYDGEIIDDQPGKVLTYRSAPEEPFEETGSLIFEPIGNNATDLVMKVSWTFPGAVVGTAISKAMEPISDAMLTEELNNLKRVLEDQRPTMPTFQ